MGWGKVIEDKVGGAEWNCGREGSQPFHILFVIFWLHLHSIPKHLNETSFLDWKGETHPSFFLSPFSTWLILFDLGFFFQKKKKRKRKILHRKIWINLIQISSFMSNTHLKIKIKSSSKKGKKMKKKLNYYFFFSILSIYFFCRNEIFANG